MRTRLVLMAFVLGAVVVGAAVAGLNRNWSTHLTGANEVPADTLSAAQGQASLHLSQDGSSLRYRLNVANIESVTQAHIHLAPAGANGMIVAWLYPSAPPAQLIPGTSNGVLGAGTITAANLMGPLVGQPLSALVDALNAGNAYVNVHTSQFPGGEIRGNVD
jgi:CHRD domain